MSYRPLALPSAAEMTLGVLAAAFLAALAIITPAAPVMLVAAAAIAIGLVAAIDHPEVGLVMLVAAATLDLTGRLAEFGPFKVTIYQGLVVYMAVILVVRLIQGRSRLQATPIDLPAALFLGIVAVSLLVARETTLGVVAAISLFSSVFLAYAVVALADTPRRLAVLVLGAAAVGGVIGVFGILERIEIYAVAEYLPIWGEGVRARVTFKDPNIMGSFQLTAAALGLPLVLMMRDWRIKSAWLVVIVAAGVGMLTTGSRGAVVGFAIALFVMLALARVRPAVKLAVLMVVVLLASVWFAFLADPVWFENRVINVADDGSLLARVYMGASATEMFADNPGGLGIGNYPTIYPFYRDASVRHSLIESHTAYLTLLVETGWLGLLAFMSVLAAASIATLRAAFRARNPTVHAIAVGAIAASVGLAAQAFTYSLENSKFWWLSIGIGLAAWSIVRRGEEDSAIPDDMDGALES